MTKANLGGKCFISSYNSLVTLPSSLPESGQKLRARTWEQKLQQKPGGGLLACSPCSVFLLIPSPPLTCPQVSLAVGIFSSQVYLGLRPADIRSASAPSGCVWYVTMSQLFHWLGLSTTEGLPSVCKALGFIPCIAHLSYKR